jgi:DNA-binding transcriptional regulator YhcF (GntR family)
MNLGSKSEKIYITLSEAIRNGIFLPGDRIPTEQELCGKFSASRNTVRQAIKKLMNDDHVYSIRGSGCYVKQLEDSGKTVSLMYHGDLATIVHVQNILLARGCLMNIFSQLADGWDPNLEGRFLERVFQQQHYGLIASCTPLTPYNEPLLAKLNTAGIKVVHIEPYRSDKLPAENYVMPDYRAAGWMAAAELCRQGARRLIFNAGCCIAPYALLAKQGFVEYTAKYSVECFIHENHGPQLKDFAAGVGVLALPYERAVYLDNICGGKLPVVSFDLAGDKLLQSKVTVLKFNRYKIFDQAINVIINRNETIQILIKPEI